MRVTSPTGKAIIGTYEVIPGVALVREFRVHPDGTVEYEYAGETDVLFDDQYTSKVNGDPCYVDEDGHIWPESRILFDGKTAQEIKNEAARKGATLSPDC